MLPWAPVILFTTSCVVLVLRVKERHAHIHVRAWAENVCSGINHLPSLHSACPYKSSVEYLLLYRLYHRVEFSIYTSEAVRIKISSDITDLYHWLRGPGNVTTA